MSVKRRKADNAHVKLNRFKSSKEEKTSFSVTRDIDRKKTQLKLDGHEEDPNAVNMLRCIGDKGPSAAGK